MGLSIRKIFDWQERELARLWRIVAQINALEPTMQSLSDEELRNKTNEFRQRLAAGATLDDLLPEAYAAVREAARRTLGERHFDVQLLGGIALHLGYIAEMKTGEGKTLTATLPLYLNALLGRGVHLVSTNDFLVRWQAQWMEPVYEALGMSVGYIQHSMTASERRAMYARDITYVENSELGFDYLRDNMCTRPQDLCLRELFYAIVDEADSILIDEARVPLIISGETEETAQNYRQADEIVRKLLRAHTEEKPLYVWDKKDHQAALTEAGQQFVEKELHLQGSLVDPENLEIAQLIDNALKAHKLYERDVHYIVRDGEVILVDEFTGHLQPGRRYSDGLHQAIEAKERVYTPRVRQTVATITYQNFFRMYEKLAGMTGTAKSEEHEFTKIYGCRVLVIPTNRPVIRKDYPDLVFKTKEAKYRGIINEIIACHVRDQPVLVGTRSVEVSEHLAGRLAQDWLQAHVLVQILLRKIYEAGKQLDHEQKEAFLALLRQPMEELVEQARYLKRRSLSSAGAKGKQRKGGKSALQAEITLGDIVAYFDVPEQITDPANLEYFMENVLGIVDEKTAPETRQLYMERLTKMISEGMKPGDEDHESQLNVLNAKRHEAEGKIIARAGEPGMITIATNMAGRGVDIVLGGRNPAKGQHIFPERYEYVKSLGGLHVIGTERHESRRIDDQLRGRSGRQGDPGSSRFYVSLEDELMQLFGPERFRFAFNSWPEEEAIEARLVSRAIERAQEKVELRNFTYRKHTLEYDDVMNQQRSIIYAQRRRVLNGENVQPVILRMIDETAQHYLQQRANPMRSPEEWQLEQLYEDLVRVFSTPPEDEGRSPTRRRRGGAGIAVALAERDLRIMAEMGEDLAAYLRQMALPHGHLKRNVDPETAKELLQEEVRKTVEGALAEFCPAEQPIEKWRIGDLVRVLEEKYEGVAYDLGREGLLAIPPEDLHNEIRRIVRELYIGRERTRMDLFIERTIQGFLSIETPSDAEILQLAEYLDYYLHDILARLAVDALEEASDPVALTIQQLALLEQLLEERQERDKKAKDDEAAPLSVSIEALQEKFVSLAAQLKENAASPLRFVDFFKQLTLLYDKAPLALAHARLKQLIDPQMSAALRALVREEPQEGENVIGLREFRAMERAWLLSSVDRAWMHHLRNMDELREGIHLRGHAQRDPLIEYQKEASELFEQMMMIIAQRTTQKAFSSTEAAELDGFVLRGLQTQMAEMPEMGGKQSMSHSGPKIGRNDPCPCGSGKKYKLCCMQN